MTQHRYGALPNALTDMLLAPILLEAKDRLRDYEAKHEEGERYQRKYDADEEFDQQLAVLSKSLTLVTGHYDEKPPKPF